MGTETDTKSSNLSEIQPLEEFDPNQEPVGELAETDEPADQEQANESDPPVDTVADEPETPIDGVDGQVESDAQETTDEAGGESEMDQDKPDGSDGEVDETDSDKKVNSLAAAPGDPDSDGGADSEDETKVPDSGSDGDSPAGDEQSAGAPPKEPSENNDDGAVAEVEDTDSEPDGDGNSSDKEEQPAEDSPKEPAANNGETDFAALDDDEVDDGVDSKLQKEEKAAEGDEKQEKTGEDPAKNKAATDKDPGQTKKTAPKKEPLPESTANSQKTKKSAKDSTPSKKIIGSIIIIFMIVGAVIYSRPALFGLKKKQEDTLPAKAEIKTPAKQPDIQTQKPAPPGKNDRYLSKIEDVTRLREQLLAKKEEIYRLKLHYRNGVVELKDQLYREMQDADIYTFDRALENKRIELGLRTIQRREVYIQELEKPDQWVHNGSEELLFLKRKALLDLQMTDIASGIDLNRHMRYMNAAIQKYQPSADKLAVDPPPAQLTPLETIWSQIHNQQDKNVQTPIGQENKKIIAEICSGNYGRIAELTAITPKAAKCLARMNGSELFLNGLTQLTPDEAKYLFKWRGNWIGLNSVKNLSPAVAKYLFKWNGNWISLNGLTELPPELALYLTEWQGNQLELMGLNFENSKPDKRTLKYLTLWETMGGKLFVSDDIRNEMARVM